MAVVSTVEYRCNRDAGSTFCPRKLWLTYRFSSGNYVATLFGFGARSVYHAWGFIVTIFYGVGTDINRREFAEFFLAAPVSHSLEFKVNIFAHDFTSN